MPEQALLLPISPDFTLSHSFSFSSQVYCTGDCVVGANGAACENGGTATGSGNSCGCDCSSLYEGANCESALTASPIKSPTASGCLAYTLDMSDSRGNGWGDTVFYLTPRNDVDLYRYTASLGDGDAGTATFPCLAKATEYDIRCGGGGTSRSEVSWKLINSLGVQVASGTTSGMDWSGGLPVETTFVTEA